MAIKFNVGYKCAVMLPRKFINPQVTPAKGLIVNKLIDSRSLILLEEVWQFKGLFNSPLTEMCFSTGRIKSENWGWKEIPSMVASGEYLMVPADQDNLMEISDLLLEKMIKKSVIDFQEINGFI